MLNIGRVILPTVKLIYDRDMESKNFVPKTYDESEGNFTAKNGTFKGKYIYKGKESRIDDLEECKKIVSEINSDKGTIKDKKVTNTKEYAP